MSWEGITVDGVQHFGTGTWVLTDTVLTCNIITLYGNSSAIGIRQTLTATYNKTTGTLTNGKWVDLNGTLYHGIFTVTKVH